MDNIKLVIFDIDGTLVDTTELFLQAYEHVFQTHNIEKKSREELRNLIAKTKTLLETYKTMLPGQNIEHYLKSHHEFRRNNMQLAKTFPNTINVLKALRASGIKVAGFTNRVQLVRESLEQVNIYHLLDKTISADDAGAHKPDPAGIYLLLKHFNVSAEHTVMVGDTEVDVLAGRAAGTATVGVLTGFVPSSVTNANPDFLLKDLGDLLPLIIKNSAGQQ